MSRRAVSKLQKPLYIEYLRALKNVNRRAGVRHGVSCASVISDLSCPSALHRIPMCHSLFSLDIQYHDVGRKQQAFDLYERGGRGALGEISDSNAQADTVEEATLTATAAATETVDGSVAPLEDPEEALPVPVRPRKKAAVQEQTGPELDPKKYHTDIPLPDVLLKHLRQPGASLQDRSRVTGFRIELNGRLKGSDRGIKQSFGYGKIGTNDFANRNVDFGKSYFITRRGTIGVKVTVGYER